MLGTISEASRESSLERRLVTDTMSRLGAPVGTEGLHVTLELEAGVHHAGTSWDACGSLSPFRFASRTSIRTLGVLGC